jgi:hypothetical protein
MPFTAELCVAERTQAYGKIGKKNTQQGSRHDGQ